MSWPVSRRAFLVGCTAATLSAPVWGFAQDIPPMLTGEHDPRLQPFDDLLLSFLKEHDVPGMSVAVTKGSRLAYSRGCGWANKDTHRPVQPDALFRIASLSKPITAVAVMQLVEQGRLRLDDRLLDIVPLVPFVPPGQSADPRIQQITIRQLLQHTAGWDRDVSFDPIIKARDITQLMQLEGPPGPLEVTRYALGLPLDFNPGERYAYSNVGYLCLGRVIEHLTQTDYVSHVQQQVLQPLGITRMQLGKAREAELAEGEVHYYDRRQRVAKCLYPPQVGAEVPVVYGGENLQGYEAHGGWIASAVDLARFAAAFADSQTCPLLRPETIDEMWRRPTGLAGHTAEGSPRPVYYGCGWSVRPVNGGGVNAWHTGRIAGTSTLMVRRSDGMSWAVLFNSDALPGATFEALASAIDPLMHRAAAQVQSWPEVDRFDPPLTLRPLRP